MTAYRHHEHARRISGFIWQNMNERGIQCPLPDVENALQELTAAQLASVEQAAQVLAKGGDSRDGFELLAALRSVARSTARAALRQERIIWRADVLLQAATGPAMAKFNPALSTLLRPQASAEELAAAVATLQELCGSLASDEATPVPETAAAGERGNGPPATRATPPARQRRPGTEDGGLPRQVKVFAKSGALTVEHAPLRDGGGTTVIVEAAKRVSGSDAYEWGSKIIFQLTLRELPQFFALLMGWIDVTQFRFHGPNNDKGLEAEHQDHGLYLVVTQGPRKVGVPVVDADRYALATLVLAAMVLNEPQLNAAAVLEIARATMVAPAALAPGPKQQ